MKLKEIENELHNPLRKQIKRVIVINPTKHCYLFIGYIVECDWYRDNIKVMFSPKIVEWYKSEDLEWE